MPRAIVFRLTHLLVMIGVLCLFGGVMWLQGCREHSSALKRLQAASDAKASSLQGSASRVAKASRGQSVPKMKRPTPIKHVARPVRRHKPSQRLSPVAWYHKGALTPPKRRFVGGTKGMYWRRFWGSRRRCFPWRPIFLQEGLMLTRQERKAVLRAALGGTKPAPSKAQLRLARKYQRVVRAIGALKECVAFKVFRYSGRTRRRYERRARALIYDLLNEVIMPIWLGTPWAFYGTAEVPHQKAIACGYFVLHALKGVGFVFPQSTLVRKDDGSTMRTYEFARLPATSMMRLLSGPRYWRARGGPHDVRLWKKTLRRFGRGVYFLGLDTHVGLVLYDGSRPYFWHSSSWVAREPMYRSGDVLASKYRRLGYMSRWAIRMWLENTPVIVPDGWYR